MSISYHMTDIYIIRIYGVVRIVRIVMIRSDSWCGLFDISGEAGMVEMEVTKARSSNQVNGEMDCNRADRNAEYRRI